MDRAVARVRRKAFRNKTVQLGIGDCREIAEAGAALAAIEHLQCFQRADDVALRTAAQAGLRQEGTHRAGALADHRLQVHVVDELQAVVEALEESKRAGGMVFDIRVVGPRHGHEASEGGITVAPVREDPRRHGAHVRRRRREQPAAPRTPARAGAQITLVVEQHLRCQQPLDRHIGAPDARGERGVILAGGDDVGDGIGRLAACLGPEIEAKSAHEEIDGAEAQVLDAHPRVHRLVEAFAKVGTAIVTRLGAERLGPRCEGVGLRRQPFIARQGVVLDQGCIDARVVRCGDDLCAQGGRRSRKDQENQGKGWDYAGHGGRPIRQSERRKASSAARSSPVMATTRSFAACASPPCQRMASRRLRALPSCRKNV